jgi:hypothetical protein
LEQPLENGRICAFGEITYDDDSVIARLAASHTSRRFYSFENVTVKSAF